MSVSDSLTNADMKLYHWKVDGSDVIILEVHRDDNFYCHRKNEAKVRKLLYETKNLDKIAIQYEEPTEYGGDAKEFAQPRGMFRPDKDKKGLGAHLYIGELNGTLEKVLEFCRQLGVEDISKGIPSRYRPVLQRHLKDRQFI